MSRIVVDVDGVMYNWDKTARYMMRTYRGHQNNVAMHIASQDWNWIQNNVSKDDWHWLWNRGVKQGLFRYGHLISGAVKGLQDLLARGHKLVICTHRPESAVKDTLAWLNLLNIPFAGIYILSDGRPKTSVKGDILIDDKPENVEAWAGDGRWAVLLDQPWNSSSFTLSAELTDTQQYYLVRAYGWDGVVNLVDAIEAKEAEK